jgi:hypothetical protein
MSVRIGLGLGGILVAVWAFGCGSGRSSDTGSGGNGNTPAVCTSYCDRGLRECGVPTHGCLGACQGFLGGKCAAEWNAVYTCGATADAGLTCDPDAGVVHAYQCLSELANAGNCMFPPDAS